MGLVEEAGDWVSGGGGGRGNVVGCWWGMLSATSPAPSPTVFFGLDDQVNIVSKRRPGFSRTLGSASRRRPWLLDRPWRPSFFKTGTTRGWRRSSSAAGMVGNGGLDSRPLRPENFARC